MVLNKTCLSTPLFLQVLYLQKKKKKIFAIPQLFAEEISVSPRRVTRAWGTSPLATPRVFPLCQRGAGPRWMLRDRLQLRFLAGAAPGEPGQRSRVGAAPALSRLPRSPRRGPALSSLGGAEGGREGGEGFSSALSSAPVPGVSPGQRARGRTGALGGAAGGGAGGTAGRLRLPCRGRVSSELPSLLFPSSGSAAIVCGAELTR